MSEAVVVAAELAQDGPSYVGLMIHVVDEEGNEIGRAPVAVGS